MQHTYAASIPPLELTAALDGMGLSLGSREETGEELDSGMEEREIPPRKDESAPIWSDSDSEHSRQTQTAQDPQDESHIAFEQKRHLHYNMRAALEARYDDEDDEEEDDEEIGDLHPDSRRR